jgi:hypothetical protein
MGKEIYGNSFLQECITGVFLILEHVFSSCIGEHAPILSTALKATFYMAPCPVFSIQPYYALDVHGDC